MDFSPNMEIFRISKNAYGDIKGNGGLYYPGRWHNAGQRIVYTAQNRSLAALESLVHLSKTQFLANGFIISTISIPENSSILSLSIDQLSEDWRNTLKISETRLLGDQFLLNNEFLIMKVPSAIIKDEFNFILNPEHPEFKNCSVINQQNFTFDSRFSQF